VLFDFTGLLLLYALNSNFLQVNSLLAKRCVLLYFIYFVYIHTYIIKKNSDVQLYPYSLFALDTSPHSSLPTTNTVNSPDPPLHNTALNVSAVTLPLGSTTLSPIGKHCMYSNITISYLFIMIINNSSLDTGPDSPSLTSLFHSPKSFHNELSGDTDFDVSPTLEEIDGTS
jgi:hypothetical protein